jgi:N-acetylmuramic acid 6-phosphate etherase
MTQRPTEARHPHSDGLHARDGQVVLGQVLAAQLAALSSVQPAIPALETAAHLAAKALQAGRKVAYAGAGSAGLMALADALELAGTFGIPPQQTPVLFAGGSAALLHMTGGVEDDPALALADLDRHQIGQGDVVICVSASGGTAYTLAVAVAAKTAGATIIGIANVPQSALLLAADLAIVLDTGPEVVSGSTRMGAATAQKVALNMLSVRMGILLGHVHDGYMVNVIADNAKLVDRAARIVSALAGQGIDSARAALAQAGGAVKPAVLVAKGATPLQAAQLLKDSGGVLGPTLAAISATGTELHRE